MNDPAKVHERAVVTPFWQSWLRIAAPIVIAVVLVVGVGWPFIDPAPPSRVVIATGPEGSSYNDYAAEYKDYFAEHGIELVIRQTGGATENYGLLLDATSGVELAIVQGGTAPPEAQRKDLEAICSVSFEPLFVLYRADPSAPPLTRLDQLKEKRTAVGNLTGGTRRLAIPLLALHGITPDNTPTLVNTGGRDSVAKLKAGEVDAAFFAVDANTPYIADLLSDARIRMMSLEHADAYATRFDYLSIVTMHPGTIDLQGNVPDRDVRMVAPVTALVARKSAHKAVIQLMVQAAHKVHGRKHPLAAPGTFPSLDYTEIPIGPDARYFFGAKPNLLQRKLPFWLVSLIDRLLILVIPLLVVLIPLFRFAPALYRWRTRRRIYRWYRRIRMLDSRLLKPSTPSQRQVDREETVRLEREIAEVKVPLSYMEEFYNLRLHLAYIRDRLSAQDAQGRADELEAGESAVTPSIDARS